VTTIGYHIAIPGASRLPRPLYAPIGVLMGAVVLTLSLMPATDGFFARVLLFYSGTTLAFGLMPYVRRGDIPLVAAWVILLSELAPCVRGELISPLKVAADVLGVLMATCPIYIARLRQVMQGDTRPTGRRAGDSTGSFS
jgi:hypothetical protein